MSKKQNKNRESQGKKPEKKKTIEVTDLTSTSIDTEDTGSSFEKNVELKSSTEEKDLDTASNSETNDLSLVNSKDEKKSRLEVLVRYYVEGIKRSLPPVTCVSYQKGIIREILAGYPDNKKYTKEDLLSIVSENKELQGPNAHSFELYWDENDNVEKKAYFTLMSFLNIQIADKTAKVNRTYVSANFTERFLSVGDQLLKDFL